MNRQILLILLTLPLLTAFAPSMQPPEICRNPANLLRNCTFSEGTNGWQQFTEEGQAAFSVLQGGGECHAPDCPAGYLVVEDYFVGGIYQQVEAVPGQAYHANIVWLVFDSLTNDASIRNAVGGGMGRKVGIDPFGGTDPRSPNIVWGEEKWDNDCKICNEYQVIATAQAESVTVFLRLDDRWKIRAREQGLPVPASRDQFWVDDFGMMPVEGQVAAQAVPTDTPEPTATAVPPTATPVPPTATSEVEPSPTATVTVEVETADILESIPLSETTIISETAVISTETAVITETVAEAIITETDTLTAEVNTLAQIQDAPAPPPTLTPTPAPTATSTPESASQVALAQNVAPQSRPASTASEAAITQPNEWLSAAATTGCIVGALMMLAAIVMGGAVGVYRFTRKPTAQPPSTAKPTYTVEVVDE